MLNVECVAERAEMKGQLLYNA